MKDLLRNGGNSTHSLKVREHPKLGPYVQDLSKHLVHQYSDIQVSKIFSIYIVIVINMHLLLIVSN